MELLLALVALAVIVLAASIALHEGEAHGRHRVHRQPRQGRAPAPRATAPADPAEIVATPEGADPWVVEPQPLTVDDPAEIVGGAGGGPQAVLAYVEVPRRSPDPDRLIQTEILMPSSVGARVWAFVRLSIAVVAFGLAIGFGVIGVLRAIVWAISSIDAPAGP